MLPTWQELFMELLLDPDRSQIRERVQIVIHAIVRRYREIGRQRGIPLGSWPGVAVKDAVEDHGRGVPLKGERSSGQLVKHRAGGKEIRPGIDELTSGLLRRHVRDRADGRAG